jgi:hypothetical protein
MNAYYSDRLLPEPARRTSDSVAGLGEDAGLRPDLQVRLFRMSETDRRSGRGVGVCRPGDELLEVLEAAAALRVVCVVPAGRAGASRAARRLADLGPPGVLREGVAGRAGGVRRGAAGWRGQRAWLTRNACWWRELSV